LVVEGGPLLGLAHEAGVCVRATSVREPIIIRACIFVSWG
jgi:hypothetical protein